ncbi:uncharacterized protein [Heptranchias perlo]|uniref:uncharacterized protein isoform X3 n=1 Tax=Heptranchias perlo TaxID=212740 RepID=UPI00355A0FC4
MVKVGKCLPKYPPGSGLSMSSNCHCTSFLKSEEQGCKTQMQPQARKPTMADIDIQKLKEENKQLKYELEDLRWQYQQLLEERWNGHYDERRVTLLKAQIMQLERQVVLLTEGLSSRATQMLEIENALEPLNERFRSLLSFESPTSEVPVSRAELMQLIGMCQALQNRLQKCQTATSVENLSLQWLMSGRNLTKQPVTLLDLCYGRMDNLNLQHVVKLEHAVCQEFTVENMLSALPTFPKGTIQRQVKRAAEALVKAANYSRLMVMQQVKAQQVELDFHKSMYDIQVKYTEALFQGIKEAYRAFQDNVAKVLCLPLQEVLTSYANLKETASEAALRDFLTVFENNAEQMQDAVNALTPFHNQQSDGDEALSRFGKEFFLSLECCLKDCTDQRDSLTSKHETLKEEFNHALKTLQNLRKEKMEKRTDGGHSSQCASQSERPDEKVKVDEAASSPRDETREELNSLTAETTAATTASSLKQRSGALRMSNFTNKSVNTAFDSQDDPSKQCSSERHISQRRAKPAQKSKTKMIQQRPPWQD